MPVYVEKNQTELFKNIQPVKESINYHSTGISWIKFKKQLFNIHALKLKNFRA
ncbi:MAG: hypothetical protein GX184_04635 [Clostridiaceae bacterium]|nr:hypothetical protein [Clostridiaceae bacterium]